MTDFKRYRDQHGHEFSSALTEKSAQEKGWTDITDEEHPAVGGDGMPLPATPAARDEIHATTDVVSEPAVDPAGTSDNDPANEPVTPPVGGKPTDKPKTTTTTATRPGSTEGA